MDGGQQGAGAGVGVAPGREPACLAPGGFLELAMGGMITFLEKNHINILGDSYANKDKSWSRKPG